MDKKIRSLFVVLSLLIAFSPSGICGFLGDGFRKKTVAQDAKTDTSAFNGALSAADTDVQAALDTLDDAAGGGGAPTTADYLVGTANGSLSAEIVVGTTPGGELGGTWGSPIVDDNLTVTGWDLGASIGTTPSADDNDTSLATSAYVQTEINAMGGRSLTVTTGTMAADAETYTDTKCIWIQDPVAGDDLKSIWFAKQANTISSLWCESDQTVTAMLQVDDGTAADVDSVDLTCDSTPPEDTSLDGDATMASGDRLDLDVASVSGTPTWVSICWTTAYDD